MNEVLVTGTIPLFMLRSYAKSIECENARIINKLIITPETAHLADYAVKFVARHKKERSYHFFVAYFKNAKIMGMYLTKVVEISPD